MTNSKPVKKRSALFKNLQKVVCILAVVLVTIFALYLGVWVLFIGGIVSVVEAVKATPVSGGSLALGLLAVVTAVPIGVVSFLVGNFVAAQLWPSKR